MAVEEDSSSVGANKIEDITKLIQLYMMGVEALEGVEDKRFRFFSRKLQSLMLKKPVADQLRYAQNSVNAGNNPINRTEKRQEHEIQLMYNSDLVEKERVRELMMNVEAKLKSY